MTKTKITLILTTLIISLARSQIVQVNATARIPPLTKCIEFPQHYSTPNSTEFKEEYCGTATTWPITVESFVIGNENHTKALELYTTYYEKYLDNPDRDDELKKLTGVNYNCLAVLRKVVCAYYFPRCDELTGEGKFGVCTHSCDLVRDRCPTETELIQFLCSKDSRGGSCAVSYGIQFLAMLVLVALGIILVEM